MRVYDVNGTLLLGGGTFTNASSSSEKTKQQPPNKHGGMSPYICQMPYVKQQLVLRDIKWDCDWLMCLQYKLGKINLDPNNSDVFSGKKGQSMQALPLLVRGCFCGEQSCTANTESATCSDVYWKIIFFIMLKEHSSKHPWHKGDVDVTWNG